MTDLVSARAADVITTAQQVANDEKIVNEKARSLALAEVERAKVLALAEVEKAKTLVLAEIERARIYEERFRLIETRLTILENKANLP